MADAPVFNSGDVTTGLLGVLARDLKRYGERIQKTALAQFYDMVIPGLVLTRHIFSGLDRPLYCDDDPKGDQKKLVYARKPTFDAVWSGGADGNVVRCDAPKDKVFVVIVSLNQHRENYPTIDGWIERWNWVDEDPYLSEAPDEWVDRYEQRLWTR